MLDADGGVGSHAGLQPHQHQHHLHDAAAAPPYGMGWGAGGGGGGGGGFLDAAAAHGGVSSREAEALQQLAAAFPGYEASSLLDILRDNDGDVALAAEAVAEMLELEAGMGGEYSSSAYYGAGGWQQSGGGYAGPPAPPPEPPALTHGNFPSLAPGGPSPASAPPDFASAIRGGAEPPRDWAVRPPPAGVRPPPSAPPAAPSAPAPAWVPTGTAVSAAYEDARVAASEHARLRNAAFEQARVAYTAGDGAAARAFSERGRFHKCALAGVEGGGRKGEGEGGRLRLGTHEDNALLPLLQTLTLATSPSALP